jgi:carbon-monoxide dehydrogenase large subunit
VHDEVPGNVCYVWALGDKGATDAAFAKAAHVTSLEFINNRLIPNALEPRACNAQYSRHDDSYTLYVSNQNPHVERLLMTAFVLGLPEHKVRVIAPDVGGGFGSKIYLYAEETVCVWASKLVGRPIKWTAERTESFLSDAHGRDHFTKAELALDKDGRFLGMRVKTSASMGAYLSDIRVVHSDDPLRDAARGAVQDPGDPLRSDRGLHEHRAGRRVPRRGAAGSDLRGRAPGGHRRDRARHRAGRDPAPQLHPRVPLPDAGGALYDTGDYDACLDGALKLADVAGFKRRKEEAAKRGMLRGLGFSSYIEACGLAPSNVAGALGARAGLFEAGEVRVHPTGKVTVFTGSHSHGQGHETTFAQVVADRLGIPMDDIDIVHGDTGRIPFGMGTYGSRSLAVGGTAIMKAVDKIVAKGRKIAAHLMEVSDGDVEFRDGKFSVKGTDKNVPFAQVALTAYVPHNYPLDKLEPGLDETAFYDPTNFTFPAGTHICEVEVDPDTGATTIVNSARWTTSATS